MSAEIDQQDQQCNTSSDQMDDSKEDAIHQQSHQDRSSTPSSSIQDNLISNQPQAHDTAEEIKPPTSNDDPADGDKSAIQHEEIGGIFRDPNSPFYLLKEYVQPIYEDFVYLTEQVLLKTMKSANKQLQDTLMNYFLENHVSNLIIKEMNCISKRAVRYEIEKTMTKTKSAKYMNLLNAFEQKVRLFAKEKAYENLLMQLITDENTSDKSSEQWKTLVRKRILALLLIVHWQSPNAEDTFSDFFAIWDRIFPKRPLPQKVKKASSSTTKAQKKLKRQKPVGSTNQRLPENMSISQSSQTSLGSQNQNSSYAAANSHLQHQQTSPGSLAFVSMRNQQQQQLLPQQSSSSSIYGIPNYIPYQNSPCSNGAALIPMQLSHHSSYMKADPSPKTPVQTSSFYENSYNHPYHQMSNSQEHSSSSQHRQPFDQFNQLTPNNQFDPYMQVSLVQNRSNLPLKTGVDPASLKREDDGGGVLYTAAITTPTSGNSNNNNNPQLYNQPRYAQSPYDQYQQPSPMSAVPQMYFDSQTNQYYSSNQPYFQEQQYPLRPKSPSSGRSSYQLNSSSIAPVHPLFKQEHQSTESTPSHSNYMMAVSPQSSSLAATSQQQYYNPQNNAHQIQQDNHNHNASPYSFGNQQQQQQQQYVANPNRNTLLMNNMYQQQQQHQLVGSSQNSFAQALAQNPSYYSTKQEEDVYQIMPSHSDQASTASTTAGYTLDIKSHKQKYKLALKQEDLNDEHSSQQQLQQVQSHDPNGEQELENQSRKQQPGGYLQVPTTDSNGLLSKHQLNKHKPSIDSVDRKSSLDSPDMPHYPLRPRNITESMSPGRTMNQEYQILVSQNSPDFLNGVNDVYANNGSDAAINLTMPAHIVEEIKQTRSYQRQNTDLSGMSIESDKMPFKRSETRNLTGLSNFSIESDKDVRTSTAQNRSKFFFKHQSSLDLPPVAGMRSSKRIGTGISTNSDQDMQGSTAMPFAKRSIFKKFSGISHISSEEEQPLTYLKLMNAMPTEQFGMIHRSQMRKRTNLSVDSLASYNIKQEKDMQNLSFDLENLSIHQQDLYQSGGVEQPPDNSNILADIKETQPYQYEYSPHSSVPMSQPPTQNDEQSSP